MLYKVEKASHPPELNAIWDKNPWTNIEPLQLQNYVGEFPKHFPETQAKFYLDASPAERARRRWLQLGEMGLDEDPDKVRLEMDERDQKDSTRKHSPLKKAEDAVHIDTTGMTIEQVVDKIARIVEDLEDAGA